MGKPPGSEDGPRDEGKAAKADPDRAAILARRQRFIALALSGLATTACDKPNDDPATPKDGKAVQGGKGDGGATPRPCLNVTRVDDEGSTGKPMPCLEVMPADDGAGEGSTGKPMPCLDVAPPEPLPDDGVPPQACLKIAAPPPEPKPEPRPQPCLKVAPPKEPKEPAKPRPCLRVARPTEPKGE